MNHYARMLGISFLYCILTIDASLNTSPYFSNRSQGCDIVQEVAGLTNHVHLFGLDRFYGTTAASVKYSKSFHSRRIAECLFGNDLLGCDSQCRSIKISGSGVAGRDASKDWLADYFGLPRDYQSTILFCPRIENVTTSFIAHFGFDNWIEGLFLRLFVPLAYTKWDLNYSEDVLSRGGLDHHPGYFNGRVTLGKATTKTQMQNSINVNYTTYPNAYGVARSDLVDSFTDFACNKAVPALGSSAENVGLPKLQRNEGASSTTIDTVLETVSFPAVTFNPLCYARFAGSPCDNSTKIGIADFQFTLGYNFTQTEDAHFGVGFRVIAPTGSTPKAEYVFEPVLGNGDHWGAGVTITAHKTLWQSDDEKQELGFFFDSNIVHLFGATQKRTFDLVGKPNSRYMLAQKMTKPVSNLTGSLTAGTGATTFTAPTTQFDREFTPIANLTTLDARVSIGVQTDSVFMLAYRHGDLVCEFGYNLWTRSCENISLKCKTDSPFDGSTWVLKGDAQVYGYAAATMNSEDPQYTITTPVAHNPSGVALSPSQSNATIHAGTNGYTSSSTTSGSLSLQPVQNPGIDNPYYAVTTNITTNPRQIINNNPNMPSTTDPANTSITTQTKTSVQPTFLQSSHIDVDGARTKGFSHKIFTNLMYTWVDFSDHCDPYLGGGIKGEFHAQGSTCKTGSSAAKVAACSKCRTCGTSQWALWIKGGISFH